ncbi:hypothetical protein [Geomonas sp. Red32]|uniref:hypothetical protein n=1 Tax=Geomonas sp. Red32 TaxID=2912856 RepID=UPI00202CF079|nr:hypothetical protein [Geomonas sp. Red32]
MRQTLPPNEKRILAGKCLGKEDKYKIKQTRSVEAGTILSVVEGGAHDEHLGINKPIDPPCQVVFPKIEQVF